MRLFDPDRHEPLQGGVWDEACARDALAAIVADTRRAYQGVDGLWPIHPIDRSPERPEVLTNLYYGAAGVIWALHELAEDDDLAAAWAIEYRPAVDSLLPRLRADAERLSGGREFGVSMGELGILLLRFALDPSHAVADVLEPAIASMSDHPSRGLHWGQPGALHAARLLWSRTRDERWKALCLEHAERLWHSWTLDRELDCHLWTNELYGHRDKLVSALHGFPGNIHALLHCAELFDDDRNAELVERARTALAMTAAREGAFANWPLSAGTTTRPDADPLRVQHCVGAPGMVNALAALPRDPVTDELFVAAGELTWRAGPLAKLPSLCHGTPGNGFALLKLHARTGDPIWLERARAFAMHAIGQAERGVMRHAQRKHSLWTGDLGLALFLRACIRADARFPTLDSFFRVPAG